MIRTGDLVEVRMGFGTVTGRVRNTSDTGCLDFTSVSSGKCYYIGVGPKGNPRIRVVERGDGEPVPTAEWEGGS